MIIIAANELLAQLKESLENKMLVKMCHVAFLFGCMLAIAISEYIILPLPQFVLDSVHLFISTAKSESSSCRVFNISLLSTESGMIERFSGDIQIAETGNLVEACQPPVAIFVPLLVLNL